MDSEESAPSLLELPDPCLLAVLQCCAANDQRSLFSAARAHSRLHQAAVLALRSITAVVPGQLHMRSVLGYLRKHAQHIDSISFRGLNPPIMRQLLPNLHLSSLEIDAMRLQLQQGGGHQGVLGSAATAAFKRLRLSSCTVLDKQDGLATALQQLLTSLEHLSLRRLHFNGHGGQLPTSTLHQLPQLQQLTYLELACLDPQDPVQDPVQGELVLQPLQALTRLVDLRLAGWVGCTISEGMLSGTCGLTHLELCKCSVMAGALAGKTQLQSLELSCCSMPGGADGEVQLLSNMQHLHQLTYLNVQESLQAARDALHPAAAHYSALTASSKLQHLNVSCCTLPEGVWQHLFPAGRQLPHLHWLDLSCVKHSSGSDIIDAPAPEGSRLASCCPGLQELCMQSLQFSAELLAPLHGLCRLHTLHLDTTDAAAAVEGVWGLCQLTGLRRLYVGCHIRRAKIVHEGILLPLTRLQQLTALQYGQFVGEGERGVTLVAEAPEDEPVWRQLQRLYPNHIDCLIRCRGA